MFYESWCQLRKFRKTSFDKYAEPNPDALLESAKLNIKILEDNDFTNFKISVKSSDIFMAIKAYRKLAKICEYPLHLVLLRQEVKEQDL